MMLNYPRFLLFLGAAWLSLPFPVAAADKEIPIADIVKVFAANFEASEKVHGERSSKWKAEEKQAADAEAKAWAKEQLRVESIRHLRMSMLLLEDLNLLLSEPLDLEAGDAIKGMSRTDVRKLEKLRNDILEEEQERIFDAYNDKKDWHADERMAESIFKNEIRLDRVFEKKARDFLKKQASLKKQLAAAYKEKKRDERKINEIRAALVELKGSINEVHRYVFGYALGEGFEIKSKPGPDDATRALQGRMEETIREQGTVLRADFIGVDVAELREGTIGNLTVSSSNLGVVLDVSGSMTDFIPDLKEEIAETFSDANYREVGNCALLGKWFYDTSTPINTGKTAPWTCNEGMLRIEDLVVIGGVDALYWFCDLRDPIEFAAMRRLRKLLRRGGCSFYVKSTGNRPEREFAHLITDS